jgi:hypothetical protein
VDHHGGERHFVVLGMQVELKQGCIKIDMIFYIEKLLGAYEGLAMIHWEQSLAQSDQRISFFGQQC